MVRRLICSSEEDHSQRHGDHRVHVRVGADQREQHVAEQPGVGRQRHHPAEEDGSTTPGARPSDRLGAEARPLVHHQRLEHVTPAPASIWSPDAVNGLGRSCARRMRSIDHVPSQWRDEQDQDRRRVELFAPSRDGQIRNAVPQADGDRQPTIRQALAQVHPAEQREPERHHRDEDRRDPPDGRSSRRPTKPLPIPRSSAPTIAESLNWRRVGRAGLPVPKEVDREEEHPGDREPDRPPSGTGHRFDGDRDAEIHRAPDDVDDHVLPQREAPGGGPRNPGARGRGRYRTGIVGWSKVSRPRRTPWAAGQDILRADEEDRYG